MDDNIVMGNSIPTKLNWADVAEAYGEKGTWSSVWDNNFLKPLEKEIGKELPVHIVKYDETGKSSNGLGKFECVACGKTFTANSSLKRHHERSSVCSNWIETRKEVKTPFEPFFSSILVKLDNAMTEDGKSCKYCKRAFSTVGNLHRHFGPSNPVCNRLAYDFFSNIFIATQ